MERFAERLKASMLAMGQDPTPAALSRLCDGLLSEEESRMLLTIKTLPPIFRAVAIVCRALRVRMIWMTSGQTVPQVTGSLTADDVEVLDLLAELDPDERKRWIKLGKQFARL